MKVLRAELREVQVLTAMPEKALRKQAQSVPTPIQGKSAKRPLLNDQQMVDLIDLLGEEKLRERVQKLSDQVADDLPALMAADALPDLQARAHAMAGMCGMLGADRLWTRYRKLAAGLLKEIETACKTDKPEEARGLCNDLPDTWNATEAAMQAQVGP